MPVEALVWRQPERGVEPDSVTPQLTAAFAAVRAAIEAGRPVVLVLDDRDLLGQGEVADAALAAALLGLSRALALEGVKPGWSINAVSHRGDPAAAEVGAAVELLAAAGLSGQLLRVGDGHLGKVWP